ncbi:MAG: collagenase, partial [Clostridium sp.]
ISENKDALLKDIPPIIWNFQKNLLHEYTHYSFSQRIIDLRLSENDIPFWFKEGISEYIGFNGVTLTTLDTPIVPLTDLFTSDQWNIYRTDPAYNVYEQSYLAVNYLIIEYGSDIINAILVETKKENSFEKGLFNVTNLSLSELEMRMQ